MFKRILIILSMALLFCVGCEPPRVPTVAELTNKIWEPSSDTSGWMYRFCLLDNGSVLVLGDNSAALRSWAMEAGDNGFTIMDNGGKSYRFDAVFDANGKLTLSFGAPESKTPFTAIESGKLEIGARYILEYVGDAINDKRPAEEVYIVFDDENRIRGFAGVNNFFGPSIFTGNTGLTLGPLGSTRRGGPHMAFESRFLSLLQKDVNTFLVFNDMLYLYNGTALTMIMRYEGVSL